MLWINDLRGEGVPISSLMLTLHATKVAKENGVTDAFVASGWWKKRFLNRHKLSMRARTRQGQITPPQLDQMALKFAQLVNERMVQLDIGTIYNADQTGTKLSVNFESCGALSDKCFNVLLL